MGLENEFETAMVNEPSVFDLLNNASGAFNRFNTVPCLCLNTSSYGFRLTEQ